MKKCLIVVENLPLPKDKKVWWEALALKEAGWEVFTVSPGYAPFRWREEKEGIKLYHFPSPQYTRGRLIYLWEYLNAFFWIFLLSFYLILREGIRVLQVCNPPEIFFPLGWIIRLMGGHFIFDHHDLSPEMYLARFGRKDFFYWFLRIFEYFTVTAAEKVIYPNNHQKEVVRKRTFSKHDKFVVVPTSVETKKIYPDKPVSYLRKGRKYVLGYLGVINPQDRVDILVDMVEILVKKKGFQDLILYIMGNGDARKELEIMVKERGLKDYIYFTGWLDKEEDIRKYLSTCDLCLDSMLPNPYSDLSTLNKLLLYMAVGKPVVCFPLKVAQELLESAGSFPSALTPSALAEEVLKLLSEEDKRRKMGEKGRERVLKKFDWKKNKEKYVKIFSEL
ncbi:MAG TPA: glycosyltransferase WbuB [bacterium]|nr:glycosyltransferase WbuB [bacterium]HEX68026.1 glycosyltransferase WbuB [bacterium]